MSENTNEICQKIISFKKGLKIIADVASAINTPVSENIKFYGRLMLNIKSGMLFYGDVKPIALNMHGNTYPIVKALIEAEGEEVTYDDFAKIFNCKYSEQLISTVKTTIRGLRRRLGINRNKNPERDIFIPTGSGFYLSK